MYGSAFIKRRLAAQRALAEQQSSQESVSLPKGAADLFRTSKYSDITIVCGGQNWDLHKSIICTQSDFFAKACNWLSRQAKPARIDLCDDDDSAAVAAMLYFFYHGDYRVSDDHSDDFLPMVLHVKLYVMADKYFNERLRRAAFAKLAVDMYLGWKTNAFADAVAEIYAPHSGKHDELRELAVMRTRGHASSLFRERKRYAGFRAMAWSTPEFAADVARALATGGGIKGVPVKAKA
ncbi:hypothetical protein B0A55_01824 [Friedmanniomyces simplex]|uniref:BTB domain-containing protein n=1 Tax=Friedmanniomyces simplex TaxID=329884 RepID=A0A4U0Y192_9PEZI|nr:hypothetical protein B0A55_01824 [Friedmanniomyces simplex]